MPVSVESVGNVVVIKVPMLVKRRLGRKEIITPEGLGEVPQATAQEPLVTALARAYHWQALLDTGRYASITGLAAALGVDRCYARRILNLAMLAPDIVEAVVAGREPSGLSLERLVKGMPMAWEEQIKLFVNRQPANDMES